MEAIGRLAGGVAHDFNNLLGVIIGYGELLKKRLPPVPQLRKYTEDILQAGQRAAGLTRQLLAFSRKQVLEPKIVDLNQVIPDIAKMIRRLIGEDIEMVVNLAPDLGQILADPGQLEQVIMNLAVNARDAMPDGGRFILETSNVELDATYARTHRHVVPGRYVLLAVTDTGCGMDAATCAHAFEPFFTTKPAGKGTGLGLATVYGIVKQSGGDIWLYSEPGRGTVFKIYLPRIDAPADREEPEPPRAPLPGTETILLVEDDEALRLMTQDILQSNGYKVLSAAHPEDALNLSRAHPGSIDVLVSDVIMPGMNGNVLADRLVAERPGVKVLLVSGYTDDAISSQALVDAGRLLLLKPFTEELLTRKVREAIEAAVGGRVPDGGDRPSAG
jgi:CheY-like chemotaxis protein